MSDEFSVVLPYWPDRPAEEALAVAAVADELGYAELWVGEMATYDAFALATAIGARTHDIALTLGPLAVHVRSAVTIAMGVASVASLTGRAVDVALGTSSPLVVERWHRRDRERPAAVLDQTARDVRALLDNESTRFRLRIEPPRSSITIAAFGARAVEVAARVGDRMVLNMVTPAVAARLCARYRAEGGTRTALWMAAAVDPDDAARAQLARALVAYLAAPGYGDVFAEAGFGAVVEHARSGAHPRDLLAAIPGELVESVALMGDADSIRARIDEYRRAGVDEIALVPATAGDPAGRRTLTTFAPPRRSPVRGRTYS